MTEAVCWVLVPVLLVQLHFFKIWSRCSFPFWSYCREKNLFSYQCTTWPAVWTCPHNNDSSSRVLLARTLQRNGDWLTNFKNLEEADTRTTEKGHNGHVQFYRTATRNLTRHLPFVNELLHDLAVLHPLMLKNDQVIGRTAKKISHTIRQDYLSRLTDEWKIYQWQKIPEDGYITGHQGDGSNTYRKVYHYSQSVQDEKFNRLTILLQPDVFVILV